MDRMQLLKKAGVLVLRVGISAALLFLLFRSIDTKALIATIRHADGKTVALSCGIYFFVYVVCLMRWQMLLRATGLVLPLRRVLFSFAGGLFFNLFLPSTIGGDVMRSLDLTVATRQPRKVVAAVLLDRISGYVGLVTLMAAAMLAGGSLVSDVSVRISAVILIAVLAAALLVLFHNAFREGINRFLGFGRFGRLGAAVRNLHAEMHILRNNKRMLFTNVALSLFVQIIAPVCQYLIAVALGVKLNILYFLLLVPIVSAITLLPLSIGGLGLRDATTVYFFSKVGMPQDAAFAMSLISFLFIVLYSSIGGIMYVFTIHHRRLQHHQAPPLRPAQ